MAYGPLAARGRPPPRAQGAARLYVTDDGTTPGARAVSRWRLPVPWSVVAVAVGYCLLVATPWIVHFAVTALTGGRGDGELHIPVPAALLMVLLGGAALLLA